MPGPSVVRNRINETQNARCAELSVAVLEKTPTENERILNSGVSAPAKILQYMPMGVNVNGNNPAVNLIVEVQPVDRFFHGPGARQCDWRSVRVQVSARPDGYRSI